HRQAAGVEWHFVALRHPPAEAQQHLMQYGFNLHLGEMQADALVRAASERYPGIGVYPVFAPGIAEALRVEPFRIRPVLLHGMGEKRCDIDEGAGRYIEAV